MSLFVIYFPAEQGHTVKEPHVQILPPSPNECRNQKVQTRKKTLVCLVSDFYPDHVTVTWYQNREHVKNAIATDTRAVREGRYYRLSSRLRVGYQDWYQPWNTFTCNASFFNGKKYVYKTARIQGVRSKFTYDIP